MIVVLNNGTKHKVVGYKIHNNIEVVTVNIDKKANQFIVGKECLFDISENQNINLHLLVKKYCSNKTDKQIRNFANRIKNLLL